MFNKNKLITTYIILVLGVILGVSVIFLSSTYKQLVIIKETQTVQTQLGTYRRTIEIESINVDTGIVNAKILDRNLGTRNFLFLITNDTNIIWQDPIFENGVVVGLTSPKKLNVSDIKRGNQAFLRFFVSENGSFVAQSMSIGIPFEYP